MTDEKCHWIRQLGSAYYHLGLCKESTKENRRTPVYELQHQMMEHCIVYKQPWRNTVHHLGSRNNRLKALL